MFFRTQRSFLILIFSIACAPFSWAQPHEPATPQAEAERLYERANDYVTNIGETGYSYAYIQFYWKRAQSNLERIARVYPQTPQGQKIRAAQAKIGPFELAYFKDRVLPRLEEKKVAAFDAVNCSIFLYNLDEKRWDNTRVATMQSIVEVLARQKRWSEAMIFPVLDEHRTLRLATVFRVAARFQQKKTIEDLLKIATPAQQEVLWPILGEAMALNGTSREEIARFLDQHPTSSVRLAVLSGMIDREIDIQRAALLHLQQKDGIQKTHYSVLKLEVRDDVDAVAKTFFPVSTEASRTLVKKYHAALGQKPSEDAAAEEHTAYLTYLALTGKVEELNRYVSELNLNGADRDLVLLKQIQLLAEAGRDEQCKSLQTQFAQGDASRAEAAELAAFHGRTDSLDTPITVRERTFADLNVKDPCLLAQAIMDWTLTPNRTIRGAAPWDPIVQKFLPGFADLPLPKSKEIQNAASSSKPF
jgi:hypothetical protein